MDRFQERILEYLDLAGEYRSEDEVALYFGEQLHLVVAELSDLYWSSPCLVSRSHVDGQLCYRALRPG